MMLLERMRQGRSQFAAGYSGLMMKVVLPTLLRLLQLFIVLVILLLLAGAKAYLTGVPSLRAGYSFE